MRFLVNIGFVLLLLQQVVIADMPTDLKKATKSQAESDMYKVVQRKLAEMLRAEQNSQAVTKQMKKIWDATKNLSSAEKREVLTRIANQSVDSLKTTIKMSGSSLQDYARSVAKKQ